VGGPGVKGHALVALVAWHGRPWGQRARTGGPSGVMLGCNYLELVHALSTGGCYGRTIPPLKSLELQSSSQSRHPNINQYKMCADVMYQLKNPTISTYQQRYSNMSDNAQVHLKCPGLTGRPCCDQQPGSTSAKQESEAAEQASSLSKPTKQAGDCEQASKVHVGPSTVVLVV
jgi:hypothetical protein